MPNPRECTLYEMTLDKPLVVHGYVNCIPQKGKVLKLYADPRDGSNMITYIETEKIVSVKKLYTKFLATFWFKTQGPSIMDKTPKLKEYRLIICPQDTKN